MKARLFGYAAIRQLSVKPITAAEAKAFICEHHYSYGCHKSPNPCYGLYYFGRLIGALAFATPGAESVRASVFGPEYVDNVIELHRLVILDITERNTESWFIARCMQLLKQEKPYICGIVSFADPTEGHLGTIYKATNFLYYGKSHAATFYRDQDGRLRHPRQCGYNVPIAEAINLGWIPERRLGKHRYFKFCAADKRELRMLKQLCKLEFQAYPK